MDLIVRLPNDESALVARKDAATCSLKLLGRRPLQLSDLLASDLLAPFWARFIFGILAKIMTGHKLHFSSRQFYSGVLFSTLSIFGLSGCWSSEKTEPEIAEIKTTSTDIIDAPESELFNTARQLYYSGLYTVAKDSFQNIKDNYPLGPYAEYAEIKLADCEFETREYDAAAALYEEFLKNRPASNAIPYMMLKAGRSHALSNRGVGRDNASLERALGFYDQLLQKYPDSIYAEAAREYRLEVVRKLAAYEELVLEFYRENGNLDAYRARKKEYDAKWEPLLRSAEASVVPGSAPLATSEVASTEGKELNPDSSPRPPKPLKIARAALRKVPRLVSEPARVNLQPGRVNLVPPDVSTGRSDGSLQSIECLPEAGRLIIYLNALEASSPEADFQSIESSDGALSFTLPVEGLEAVQRDCFASGDLQVTEGGEVTLNTDRDAELLRLSNPSRFLLQLK